MTEPDEGEELEPGGPKIPECRWLLTALGNAVDDEGLEYKPGRP